MDLRAAVLDVLQANASRALTFDDVVKGVAERLERDIRANLNELAAEERILRHVGGRDHRWRYQAPPIKPRRI
jgi:hypothetical protein